MEWMEFLVFLITMVLLVFLAIRRAKEAKRMGEHPEESEDEEQNQEEALREFLRSMNIEMIEEAKPPPPPRKSPSPSVQEKMPPPYEESYRAPLFSPEGEEFCREPEIKEKLKTRTGKGFFTPLDEIVEHDYGKRDPMVHSEVIDYASRARNILGSLTSKQEMVVLSEILHQPKAWDE